MSETTKYAAMVESIDDEIKDMLELKKHGLDKTP